jgi:cation diffusion facilitator CzcD-associated flavoprotein CzcO
MQAWLGMSAGMYLKSFAFATNIYTPQPNFDFTGYCVDRGLESVEPAEIAEFARYGLWVQKQLVPEVEETDVIRMTRHGGRFELTLTTEERVLARRVINAIGLSYFERLPKELEGLSPALASHTAQHGDFSPFEGRHVVVVGAGQSALQAAALLHEHGAEVEMCVRGAGIWFGGKMPDNRPILERLRAPNTVLGPGRDNWVLEHAPMLTHYVRDEKRVEFTRRHLGPGGAWWLRDRVVDRFPVRSHLSLRAAARETGGLRLRFVHADGSERVVRTQHVIAGTGYEVDVDSIPYLDPALTSAVARIVRAPRLSRHFESSVPGLYFVGPSSAFSFGPLYRFVAGARYTSRVVTRRLARSRGVSAPSLAPREQWADRAVPVRAPR